LAKSAIEAGTDCAERLERGVDLLLRERGFCASLRKWS
jgi:hypothetical protein